MPLGDDPDRLDHYLNAATNIRSPGNSVGGTYTFNYDVLRDRFLQQRFMVYYNTQCCGVQAEYQTFDFRGISRARIPADNRFNLSFTLAGIGSFSNFFGMFGGNEEIR